MKLEHMLRVLPWRRKKIREGLPPEGGNRRKSFFILRKENKLQRRKYASEDGGGRAVAAGSGSSNGGGVTGGKMTVTQKAFSRISKSFVEFYSEDVSLSSLKFSAMTSKDCCLEIHVQLAELLEEGKCPLKDVDGGSPPVQSFSVYLKGEDGKWEAVTNLEPHENEITEGFYNFKPLNVMHPTKRGEDGDIPLRIEFFLEGNTIGALETSTSALHAGVHYPASLCRDGEITTQVFLSSVPVSKNRSEVTINGNLNCLFI